MLTIKQLLLPKRRFIPIAWLVLVLISGQHTSASDVLSGGFAITLNSPSVNGFNIPCNGQTGTADLTIIGGQPPFNINWSNGATSEDLTGITAGTYTVTVTDANLAVESQSITINQPPLLQVSITTNDATCSMNNGSATANGLGGAGGLGYLWNTGSGNQVLSAIGAGVYTVTVTDINGCSASTNNSVNNITGPSLNNVNIDNVNCFGGTDGSIAVSFSGGGSNSYLWNDGSTAEDRVNLPAGTYTVTVTDQNSCTTIESFNIIEPTGIAVSASTAGGCGNAAVTATAGASGGSGGYVYNWSNGASGSVNPNLPNGLYTVTATDVAGCTASTSVSVVNTGFPVVVLDSTVNPSCFGIADGDIYISVSAGVPPYTFLWSNGSTVEDQINIAGGNYSVVVTDSIGCTDTLFATLTTPGQLLVNFSISDPTCGQTNGSITAIPSGGTTPYQYLWSTAATTQTISGLNAGTFTVTVTDINNCQASDDVVLTQHPSPVIGLDSLNNVSCFGASTGDIYISISQGTSPFGFQWSNGVTTEDNINIPAGQYTITVTDAFNCTSTTSYTISQNAQINIPVNVTPATCNQSNGTATAAPTGGVGPYTYLWSNGQTTATASNLPAGNVTVTVTDGQSCSMSQTANVPATGQPLPQATITNVSCNGGNNGSIDLTVTGGVSPYTFQWSPGGQTTEDISGLTAGTYTVTITDNLSCSSTNSYIVTEPLPLSATFDIYNSSCSLQNGAIAVNAAGGTPSYSYQWNTGSASDSIGNVFAGTYTVTVTDFNSCSGVFSGVIGNVAGPSINVDSTVAPLCSGGSGSVYITVTSGQSPYGFLWSNGFTGEDLINVPPGNYTVTVTDAGSCTATASATVPLTDPVSFDISSTNATCSQANGSATVNNITGGTSPYTVLWSTGATTLTASNLQPGVVYTVTVTDLNTCSASDTISIGNSGGPVIGIPVITNVSCYGAATGSILITPVGIPPLTIQWSNGDASVLADSLTAGTYTVTVTDLFNCPNTAQFSVTQSDSISVSFAVTPETCGSSNGAVTATASGGNGSFSYIWSNGTPGATASSLSANIYTVTVTDVTFCSVTRSVQVPGFQAININLDSQGDVSCNGAADGFINVSIIGGTPPVSYAWSNGQTTEDLSGLAGANYTLTVVDSAGCSSSFTTLITEPAPIDIQYTVDNASCANATGSITTNISGGVPGYSYLWSNNETTSGISNLSGGTYTLTVTDASFCQAFVSIIVGNDNGPGVSLVSHQMVSCSGNADGAINVDVINGQPPYTYLWSTGATTQNVTGLPPGIYNLTVTDADNCIGTFTDTISEPVSLSATAVLSNPTCFQANGTIVVTPVGGTSSYGFVWSTGAITSTVTNLVQDIYTVTITDAMLCTFDTSFTLVNSGAPVINLVSLNNASCFGATDGSIDIDVSGGVQPYSYLWQGILVTTQDLQNIGAGVYNISVTDSTGCTSNAQYTVGQDSQIVISFPVIENATCGLSNGSIFVQATGGNAPYTFLWSTTSTSDNIFNLSAGSYTVTVTDAAGCSQSDIANISNLSGPQIQSIDSTLVSCPGASDGSITVTATGGTPPLTYSWTNVTSTSPTVSNLPANTYTVTITDADNCQVIRTINITEPAPIVINATLSQNSPPYNLSCYQSSDGSIDVTVTGGTQPYLYIWSTGSNNEDISNLTAGLYSLIVRDAGLCQETDSFMLTQPPQITTYAGADRTICGVDSLQLNADTLTGNLIGQWTMANGDTTVDFSNASDPKTFVSGLPLGANTLLWSVSQLNGSCTVADSVIVVVTTEVNASAGIDKTNLCGTIYTMSALAVQSATSSAWSLLSGSGFIFDSTLNTTLISGLGTGPNYFIWTVRNGNCIDKDTVLVNVLPPSECLSPVELPNAYSPNGDGHNDFFEVRGIDDYPDNTLTVFNRWGIEVYSRTGYLNEWDGMNNNNEPLPDGTYFYVLRVAGFQEVFNGFVDLRR